MTDRTTENSMEKATEFLIKKNKICPKFYTSVKRRRLISLNTQEIFNSLVGIYAKQFFSQWRVFRDIHDVFYPPSTVVTAASETLARVYISHWFVDLYISIRDACNLTPPSPFSESILGAAKTTHYSTVYDAFLREVNASIRPTRIIGTMDNSICIPVIADNSKIENPENPFAINGFILNRDFFYGILSAMQKQGTGWNMSVLSTEATGRPFWLLDWHKYDEVCAWFPFGENFNFEDVTLAYIVGVPCTPNLGYRDVDEWQPALPDEDFNNIDHRSYSRIRLQTYFGAYEVRTIESTGHPWAVPHPCQNVLTKEGIVTKRPRTTEDLTLTPLQQQMADSAGSSVNMVTAMKKGSMVRITDWVYFYRVILKLTDEFRSTCLWMITID